MSDTRSRARVDHHAAPRDAGGVDEVGADGLCRSKRDPDPLGDVLELMPGSSAMQRGVRVVGQERPPPLSTVRIPHNEQL
jgi:hypothetical protein